MEELTTCGDTPAKSTNCETSSSLLGGASAMIAKVGEGWGTSRFNGEGKDSQEQTHFRVFMKLKADVLCKVEELSGGMIECQASAW